MCYNFPRFTIQAGPCRSGETAKHPGRHGPALKIHNHNTQMNIHYYLILTAAMVFSLSADPAKTEAAGQVRLVLVSDAQGTAMTFQDWGQALAGAGIKNVRLRTATETDKVGIEVQGDGRASAIYSHRQGAFAR